MLNLLPARAETRKYLFREKSGPMRDPAEVALTHDAANFGLVVAPGRERIPGSDH